MKTPFGYEVCLAAHAKPIGALLHASVASTSCWASNASFFIENKANVRYNLFESKVYLMRNDKLSVQSMDFAVSIIQLVKRLKDNKEHIIANQIGRSGTSVGANIREAQYAHGKADFIAKMQIALKEATKRDIGWSCFSEPIISTRRSMKA